MTSPLDQEKQRLRAAAKACRNAAAEANPDAGRALRDQVGSLLESGRVALGAGVPVSGYWPKGKEIDPRPLMAHLADRGHSIGLPVMIGMDKPLLFRHWKEGDTLEPVGFGLLEPVAEAPELSPSLLLVPLLAFDRTGIRLGYGGGFYDRTLKGLRAQGPTVAIGLAFGDQELDQVPHHEADQALDWVVTEREAIAIAAGR
ncbi:MAG: 5-formyltetrahydrofolate cyclo-ligase [Pseudomonadota bacterium]